MLQKGKNIIDQIMYVKEKLNDHQDYKNDMIKLTGLSHSSMFDLNAFNISGSTGRNTVELRQKQF